MTPAAELLDGERAHLEAGAELLRLPGAVLAHMPHFRDLPSAAIVSRLDAAALHPDPLDWLVRLEGACATLGLARSRLLVAGPAPEFELALGLLGYGRRAATAFMRQVPARVDASLELVPVSDEAGWAARNGVQSDQRFDEDGAALDVDRVTMLEQAKARAGALEARLACRDGEAIAALTFHRHGGMLQLRRLAVAPAHRRRGVGTAIVAALIGHAAELGVQRLGAYATPGSTAAALLRRAGFSGAGEVACWSRELLPFVPARHAWRAQASAGRLAARRRAASGR